MKTRSKLKINNDNSKNDTEIEKETENGSDNKILEKTNSESVDEEPQKSKNNNERNSKKYISKKAKIYFVSKDNVFVLSCVACKNTFPDVPDFLNHICSQKEKSKKYASKTCKTLEESIGTETNLIIGEDGLWHCRICDKGYEKKNSLKKHEQAHLLTYTCEICGKGLKSSVNLREHMNVHSGVRPYKCNLCPMAFARKWGLTSHIRSHIGDKRYSCQHCGKKFINGAILKIHIRMVHTKEKPCQCELCGQNFYSNQLLKEHKKRHMNIRPYKCEYQNCGKSFYDKKQLNRHYVSHSDEKPFECTFNDCHAKFARHKTLQAHLKIHSGIKDYICTICGKGFAMNYNLTSHMRSHANGKVKMNKESPVKRQYHRKNKKIDLKNINDKLHPKIKEELENFQLEEADTFLIENKPIIETESDEQSRNISYAATIKESENKINIIINSDNIEYDDKNLIDIYDNTRNLVPSNTSTPIPAVDDKLNNVVINQTSDNDIPVLDLPQQISIENHTSAQGMGSITTSISQVLTMNPLTFHGNNVLHIYQLPNS